jgi:hypothetical protein
MACPSSARTRAGLLAAAATACSAVLFAAAGQASEKTDTLRFYVKDVSMKITHADGTVVDRAPYPQPAAGDTMDINSLNYRGDHRKHEAKWSASENVHCQFSEAGPPDCLITVAIDGSLLFVRGTPGTVVNGTGVFQGATGRVLSLKELKGGADVVARVRLR